MKDIKEYFVLNAEKILGKLEDMIVVLVLKNGFTQNYYFHSYLLCYLFCIFFINL